MKYIKLIILSLFLPLSADVNSQSVILYNFPDEISSFPLTRVQTISFENRHINLNLLHGNTNSISLNDVNKIIFNTSSVGVTEHIEKHMLLYPNPASNHLNLQIPDNLSSTEVYIFASNVDGRKIYDRKHTPLSSTIHLDISNWDPGIYFISVFDGENTYTNKLIKQ